MTRQCLPFRPSGEVLGLVPAGLREAAGPAVGADRRRADKTGK